MYMQVHVKYAKSFYSDAVYATIQKEVSMIVAEAHRGCSIAFLVWWYDLGPTTDLDKNQKDCQWKSQIWTLNVGRNS